LKCCGGEDAAYAVYAVWVITCHRCWYWCWSAHSA